MRRVVLAGNDRRGDVIAAVEDGGEWRLSLPFPEHMIKEAALVGDDRLVCQSDEAEISLLAWRSGEEIARRPILAHRRGRMLVTADSQFIVIFHHTSIQVLRATNLETVVEGETLQWPIDESVGRIVNLGDYPLQRGGPGEPIQLEMQGDVVEDHAGRLAFVCCNCGPTDSRYGLCRIGRSDWSVQFEPIPSDAGPWKWFSPSGRYALAPHSGTPMEHDGSATESSLSSRSAQAPHRDAVVDGTKRIGVALELWKTEPPMLDAILVTRMAPPPPLEVANVAWEPAETGFWVQHGRYWNKQTEFRRVGLDGSLSPTFGFQRFRDRKVVQEIVDVADPQQVEIQAFSDAVYIQRAWCESELPFKQISEDEDGFRKSAWSGPPQRAVKRLLAQSGRHVMVVHDFSEASIIDALQRLTHDVRERLPDLLHRDVFELSFKVGQRTMTETAFFARMTRERIPVASALRDLLTTYLAVQPRVVEAKGFFRQIWGPTNQGALGPAMQALLRLDPNAHDVFRDYLAKRDGEHETHSTDVIMKIYIQETGWRDRAMVSFGIYFALIRHRDGRIALAGGLLDEYGLLHAAEGMIDADEFASLIMQEIDEFVANPGLDEGSTEDLYLALLPSLETTRYGQQVLAAIASRRRVTYLPASAEERGLNREFSRFRRFVERKQ